jgi:hypothetical protein
MKDISPRMRVTQKSNMYGFRLARNYSTLVLGCYCISELYIFLNGDAQGTKKSSDTVPGS